MTDSQTKKTVTPQKSGSTRSLLLALMGVVALAAIGYFASMRTGLDKAVVEGVLQQWAANVSERTNGETTFKYSDIKIEGGAMNRHVVLINPSLRHYASRNGTYEETIIKTAEAKIFPESVAFDAYRVTIASEIYIEMNGTKKISIASATPLETNFQHFKKADKSFYTTKQPWPEKLIITHYDSLEPSIKTPSVITITSDKGGLAEATSSNDGKEFVEMAANINNILIEDSNKSAPLAIKSIIYAVKLEAPDGKDTNIMADVRLKDIFSNEETMPYGAVSFALKGHYTGPLPQANNAVIDWSNKQANLKIDNLSLSSPKAGMSATLDFKTGTGDILPVGTGNLKVRNFAFIRDEVARLDIFKPEVYDAFGAMITRISGQPFAELTDLDVPLGREKGQSMKIGGSTLEELFAIFLTSGKISAVPEKGAIENEDMPAVDAPKAEEAPKDVSPSSEDEQSAPAADNAQPAE